MTMTEGATMTGTGYTLVIGDKNYSSWSLRPWLSLKACGAPFEEARIRLRMPDSKAEIFKRSPSGKVPALKTDLGVIYDSLAIVEYLADGTLVDIYDPPETLENNIRRVVAIWMDTRARFGQGGSLLFGGFTNADAMYAPVATRFRTYCVPLAEFGDDGTAADYVDALYALPDMAQWLAEADAEMRERELV